MAIGNTKYHQMLRRASLLSESLAWFDFFTSNNRLMIITMIQRKQLFEQGIDKFGNVIGEYSYATEVISRGEKQQGDHYTLEDSGEFYRSMFVVVYNDLFEINANAKKDDDNLFDLYGTGIIGLTRENMDILVQKIRHSYLMYAKRILLGT